MKHPDDNEQLNHERVEKLFVILSRTNRIWSKRMLAKAANLTYSQCGHALAYQRLYCYHYGWLISMIGKHGGRWYHVQWLDTDHHEVDLASQASALAGQRDCCRISAKEMRNLAALYAAREIHEESPATRAMYHELVEDLNFIANKLDRFAA